MRIAPVLAVLVAAGLLLALTGWAQSWFAPDRVDPATNEHAPKLIQGGEPAAPALRGQRAAVPSIDVPPGGKVRLTIELLMPDHSQAPGGLIQWGTSKNDLVNRASWIPARPQVLVDEGEIWLMGMRRTGASERVRVDTRRTTHVQVRIQGVPGIRGRVHLPPGLLGSRATVYALPFEGDAPPKWVRVGDHQGVAKRRSFVRRLEPTYAIQRDVEPGRYLVGLSFGEFIETAAVVDVTDFTVEQDLTIGPYDRQHYVRLDVEGLDAAAENRLAFQSQYREGAPLANVVSIPLEGGGWLIRPVSPTQGNGPPPSAFGGEHELVVSVPGRGEQRVAYTPGQAEAIGVAFPKPVDVRIRFEGLEASKLRLFRARLRRRGESRGQRRLLWTDGLVRLQSFRRGPHVLDLMARMPTWFTIASFDVDVQPSMGPVRIPVPPLYTVTVEGHAPAKHLFLAQGAKAFGPSSQGIVVMPDRSVFVFVPEGDHEVRGQYDGEQRTWPVRVVGDTTLYLDR